MNHFPVSLPRWPFLPLAIALTSALLMVAPRVSLAGEANLSWTHPTQYEDNTPIPAGTLTATEIRYGICNSTRTGLQSTPAPVTVSVPQPANTHVITGLANGAWCFAARSMIGTTASNWTQYVSKDVVNTPKPPTGLTVAGAGVAYTILKREDRLVLLPVGTVAPGTACDAEQSVNGHNVVPRESVVWSGTVRPVVVVALCA